jgi:bacterioferritin
MPGAASSKTVSLTVGGPTVWVQAAMNEFTMDIAAIQQRARANVDAGPITEAYGADRERVVAVLNEALATELVCVLRYRSHHYRATGLSAKSVAEEFLEHANEEQDHADRIAARIMQLQGEPNFNPIGLADRAHSQYAEGTDLADMIKEDIVAERIAIEIYSEIIRWLGDNDPTTRVLLQDILAVEEEHADDLLTLLGAHS